jgi:L-ascorbate metabolism protein UlaG (beta-lactamase superfamily)
MGSKHTTQKATKGTSSLLITTPEDLRQSPPGAKDHHPKKNSKVFTNPWKSWQNTIYFSNFAKAIFRGDLSSPTIPKDIVSQIGLVKPNFESSSSDSIKAIWLGHACCYIELPSSNPSSRGLRVLFDPVFSARCSPFSFMGPKRYTPAPLTVADFPEIDILCISHNHYDHFDTNTVKELVQRFPDMQVFVPLGLTSLLESVGAFNVREMDWWEELIASKKIRLDSGEEITQEARIGYLPAQHMTQRGAFDRAETLWGSFSVESVSHPNSRVFFAGDTARRSVPFEIEKNLKSADLAIRETALKGLAELPVCTAHAEIGSLRGPFKLALIPIGAYKPKYLFSSVHIDPEEAVDIYKELRAENALAIHWGAWILTNEDVMEPKKELERIVEEQGVVGFECWKIGEKREFSTIDSA